MRTVAVFALACVARQDPLGDAVDMEAQQMGLEASGAMPNSTYLDGAVSAVNLEATAAAASAPAVIPGNYRDGFNRPVLAKPNLKGRITPAVNDISYEETKLRAATADATNAVLAEERPKLLTKLKANAKAAGDKFAKSTAAANAKAAVVRAHSITANILGRKATTVCGSMSNLKALPAVCASEAATMFQKVLSVAKKDWQPAAARAAEGPAATMAANAAFKAVISVPGKVVPPVAFDAARAVFEKEWARHQKEWETLSAQKMEAMARAKDTYWVKAKDNLVAQVKSEVKKAVWDAPVKAADNKIARVADSTADKVSRLAVTNNLAPQFAASAKKALTTAVRAANGKYMTSWEATWKLAPMATQGEEK
mmetsp:Transcript_33432/g.81627  ORF Transcript_33432/g.81627 Transcript_33432/m.81627 type:complete len:368 (+) Transcript_33432:91-1194(+)